MASLLTRLLLLACMAWLPASGSVQAAAPLVLDDRMGTVDLWPAVTLRHDPEGALTADTALAAPGSFTAPQSAYATLGLRNKIVWLRIPVAVSAQSDGEWILDFDYSLLNRIDVHVIAQGRVVRHARLGNSLAWTQRPLGSRTHALPLMLQAGTRYELLIRIDTIGAMILPVTLSKPAAFHALAQNEQMLQGLLTSLGLFLLLYSLLQWLSVRESQYLKYALLIASSVLFSIHFFGIGEMYLWTDNMWMERHLAGMTSLVAACGTALFIEDVLRKDMSLWLRRALIVLASLLAVSAFGHAIDVLDIQGVAIVMGSLGLLPSLLGVPGAVARIRRGDEVGAYFLVAWLGYFIAAAVLVGVVKGSVGVSFWSMHSFQLGATLDMLIFMHIALLGTRRERRRLEEERRTFIEGQKHELARQVDEPQ